MSEASVTRIFPGPKQIRDLVDDGVRQVVAQAIIDSKLVRLPGDILTAALEGIIDALTHCTFAYNADTESRIASAVDNAKLHVEQMKDICAADDSVTRIDPPSNEN